MYKEIYSKLGLVIASEILKKEGRISLEDIKAIPFVEEKYINKIIYGLKKIFNLEMIVERISSEPYLEWDKVIILKN